MTMDQRELVADFMADLDTMFPDTGSLNAAQIKQYFNVSDSTARRWLKQNGKAVGDPRMTKRDLARGLALGKW